MTGSTLQESQFKDLMHGCDQRLCYNITEAIIGTCRNMHKEKHTKQTPLGQNEEHKEILFTATRHFVCSVSETYYNPISERVGTVWKMQKESFDSSLDPVLY